MTRFVIRNYGPSRQLAYGDKMITVAHDGVIETDDEKEAAALGAYESVNVVDRGIGAGASTPVTPTPPSDSTENAGTQETSTNADETTYDNLLAPDLKRLCKDRQIKLSKFTKPVMIEALKKYDEAPDDSGPPDESGNDDSDDE